MWRYPLLIAFSLFFLWCPTLYKRCTHAFRPAKCYLEWPYVPEWETDTPKAEIRAILEQPFSYLGKGRQSYVFQSADENYVLKLFRFDLCPASYGQKGIRWARKWLGLHEKHDLPLLYKVQKNFASCKLAYSIAPEQTGVVFVHLNPKENLPLIRVKDRRGIVHTIDPATTRFVLQKKATPLLQALRAHPDGTIVQAFSQLLRELQAVGLVNLDPTMGRNFGYLEGRVIVLDIGNFMYAPDTNQVAHFEARLHRWVEKNLHRKGYE